MDSMHKHLANKCPVRFPNKKAEVATSSGVVSDFEIVTAAGAEKHEDDNSSDDNSAPSCSSYRTVPLLLEHNNHQQQQQQQQQLTQWRSLLWKHLANRVEVSDQVNQYQDRIDPRLRRG
jgi:hypothetical protein